MATNLITLDSFCADLSVGINNFIKHHGNKLNQSIPSAVKTIAEEAGKTQPAWKISKTNLLSNIANKLSTFKTTHNNKLISSSEIAALMSECFKECNRITLISSSNYNSFGLSLSYDVTYANFSPDQYINKDSYFNYMTSLSSANISTECLLTYSLSSTPVSNVTVKVGIQLNMIGVYSSWESAVNVYTILCASKGEEPKGLYELGKTGIFRCYYSESRSVSVGTEYDAITNISLDPLGRVIPVFLTLTAQASNTPTYTVSESKLHT